MDNEELKKVLECLLFITDHPLGLAELTKIAGLRDQSRVQGAVAELKAELEGRASALQLLEVAEGYQLATKTAYAPFVRKLFAERMTMRLSTAAHETLSIVAYKQPLTRAEIEEIRGVEVIAALETLLEKRLIRVVGRKETVGRPLMYGTTQDFLRHFGLKSLEELPPIESFALPETAPAAEPAPTPSGEEAPAPQEPPPPAEETIPTPP